MNPLFLFLVVALVMLGIGYMAGRKQDDEGYNIYNRQLKKSGYYVSYAATYIGAGFFIGGTSYAYMYGLGLVWFLVGLMVGGIIFGFFAKWLHKKTKDLGFYTLPDYFRWKFGPVAAKILTGITLFILVSDMAVQLVGGGKLLETLGVLSYSTSIIITVIVVGGYLVFSGFRAVIWTDYVLLSAILLLTLVLGIFSSQYLPSSVGQLGLSTMPVGTIIGLFIFGIFEPFAISTYYQRIFAADSEKTAQKGTWIGSVAVLLPAAGLFIIGIAAKQLFPSIDPDTAFLRIIQHGGQAISLIGALVLWAALMSTIDTVTFAASHILNKDLLNQPLKKKNVSLGIVFLLGLGLIVSFVLPSVIDAGLLFVSGGMIIAPVMFFHWFMPSLQRYSVLVSLCVGIMAMVFYAVSKGVTPTLVAVSFFTSTLALLIPHFVGKVFQRKKSYV